MNKRRKRAAFSAGEKKRETRSREKSFPDGIDRTIHADETVGGVFGFVRDYGVRETIESILVAIVLAMMFRAFEAEAFIIPTGSMAPSLQGQHMDLDCEQCGYRYRTGASSEGATSLRKDRVRGTFCPICQYETHMSARNADHRSNNGDRILVNKFVYDFREPERYDVIVFKNPNNGKQNYIKRLIGLPGDNILIENGDIYLMDRQPDGSWSKRITRKPVDTLLAVLQVVDDTDFIGPKLKEANWPSRWNVWDDPGSVDMIETNGQSTWHLAGKNDDATMLRYRHYRPLKSEWGTIENGELPARMNPGDLPAGRLITDYYAYNDRVYQTRGLDINEGLHWVGDVGVEAEIEVESESGDLILEAVEGGAHFRCTIDVATGVATLSCDDPDVAFVNSDGKKVDSPSAETSLKGKGDWSIRFVNADDRLNLWINGRLVEFDAATFERDEVPVPTWSPEDGGDAEPVGMGCRGCEISVRRLLVLRDIYYTSVRGGANTWSLDNESGERPDYLEQILQTPEAWSDPEVIAIFKRKKEQTAPMFELQDAEDPDLDQFLPMGDNSPNSLDGRVWDGPNYVERDLLIGRALFIYWPHSLNKPVKYFPNFKRMKFIR